MSRIAESLLPGAWLKSSETLPLLYAGETTHIPDAVPRRFVVGLLSVRLPHAGCCPVSQSVLMLLCARRCAQALPVQRVRHADGCADGLLLRDGRKRRAPRPAAAPGAHLRLGRVPGAHRVHGARTCQIRRPCRIRHGTPPEHAWVLAAPTLQSQRGLPICRVYSAQSYCKPACLVKHQKLAAHADVVIACACRGAVMACVHMRSHECGSCVLILARRCGRRCRRASSSCSTSPRPPSRPARCPSCARSAGTPRCPDIFAP